MQWKGQIKLKVKAMLLIQKQLLKMNCMESSIPQLYNGQMVSLLEFLEKLQKIKEVRLEKDIGLFSMVM